LIPQFREIWGPLGAAYLDEISLGDAYECRLESLRDLIAIYDTEIDELDRRIHRQLRDNVGYRAIQQLNGWVGSTLPRLLLRSGTSPASLIRDGCVPGPA
jgi:hypothetical protein